jgi:hypothetical protein
VVCVCGGRGLWKVMLLCVNNRLCLLHVCPHAVTAVTDSDCVAHKETCPYFRGRMVCWSHQQAQEKH